MGTLQRGGLAVALGGALVVGLVAFAQLAGNVGGPEVALAQAPSGTQFYNAATDETSLAARIGAGPGGDLQADARCDPGDVAVGGGHIVHPSSTTGMFVTKSYATDATGKFVPPYVADRWRVKVVHAQDIGPGSTERLTVHVVCADVTAPFRS